MQEEEEEEEEEVDSRKSGECERGSAWGPMRDGAEREWHKNGWSSVLAALSTFEQPLSGFEQPYQG